MRKVIKRCTKQRVGNYGAWGIQARDEIAIINESSKN